MERCSFWDARSMSDALEQAALGTCAPPQIQVRRSRLRAVTYWLRRVLPTSPSLVVASCVAVTDSHR